MPQKRKEFDVAEARKLYLQGMSLRELAARYGVSKTVIVRRFDEIGQKRRHMLFTFDENGKEW